MKKWLIIPILILLFIIFACKKQGEQAEMRAAKTDKQLQEQDAPIAQEIATNLDTTIKAFQAGNAAGGAAKLLDTVLLVKPRESWPEGFESAISQAKEKFQAGQFSAGVGLVSDALALIRPPAQAEEEKEEVAGEDVESQEREPAPMAEAVRNKILAAGQEFKEGNGDEGVILLLEALELLGPKNVR
jgi:protein involved in sex pheromone biosynthesis